MRLRRPPQAQGRISRAKVASATPSKSASNSGGLRRLAQPWQQRALDHYLTTPECWFPAQFFARSMERTRFFPAILDEKGDPQEVESGPLRDLFDRIQDPGGLGMTDLSSNAGRLDFVIGDGYLVVSQDDGGEEAWEMCSPLELRIDPQGKPGDPQRYRRIRAPGVPQEQLAEASDREFASLRGDDVRVWRFWRRSPLYSEWSDSSVRAVVEHGLYDLLTNLTLAANAETLSRAAQRGYFYRPQELSFASVDPDAPSDDPESDPFERELQEGMLRAIRSPGSAEAMSPFVITGPAVLQTDNGTVLTKDALGWGALGPLDRYVAVEAWDKTIERIANGLDLPKPVVTGQARNHWGDWIVDEQGYRQHVAPATQRFANNLAAAYLRPAAVAAGLADADRVTIGFDATAAINHPDKVKTAGDAFDRLAISEAKYREDLGYTEDDAPDQQEYDRRVEILLKQVPKIVAQTEGETTPAQGGRGGDTTEQPPAPAMNGGLAGSAMKAAMILGAAHGQVNRAREAAGARLVQRSRSCEPCRDKIEGVPHALVAAALGPDTVREVIAGYTSEQALVAGAGETLERTVKSWGLDGEWPRELGRLVEQHALRTLYEAEVPPLPAGFAAVVEKALR